MKEFEQIRTAIKNIEQEAAEKTKVALKKMLVKLSKSTDFPQGLADNPKGREGFLLYTLPEEFGQGLLVKPEGLFLCTVYLEGRDGNIVKPQLFNWREASVEQYQQFSLNVVKRLESYFEQKAMWRDRMRNVRQSATTQ